MYPKTEPCNVEEAPARITLAELDRSLRAADPAALLVHPRILRRVIKQECRVPGFGLRVPHRKTFTVRRDALLAIVDQSELDQSPDVELRDPIILLPRPTAHQFETLTSAELLGKYWRLLFHARVHLAYDRLIADGRIGPAALGERIERLGRTEFNEIRAVLRQEDMLLPPKSDLSTYVEFAATYLELRFFDDGMLAGYFPGIEELHVVDDLLRRDLDGGALFQATRLGGLSEPVRRGSTAAFEAAAEAHVEPAASPSAVPSAQIYRLLIRRADHVGATGNLVRSAILRTRAARHGGPDDSRHAHATARADFERLARRLQQALGFSDAETDDWSKSLTSLAYQSSRGSWTAEARLLYDVQKVCVDHERGIFSLDLVRWVISLGRVPLKRPLPGQRDVLISKHLRSANARLPAVRLTGRARTRLASLLQSAMHRAETSLRLRFRPAIDRALDDVQLTPTNLPERVARTVIVDELLDRIVERGFLLMGDLRDALSRNNLKLPDLTSLRELWHGDQLLRADRRLAAALDGVYRRGEIYLRFPQKVSSVAFGTRLGRFLTRYVAIPFGGSYVTLEFLQHVSMMIANRAGYEAWHLASPQLVSALGLLLLGLIHHRGFREMCVKVAARSGRALRGIFIEFPMWIARRPLIQAFVESTAFRLMRQYLIKPLAISLLLLPFIMLLVGRSATPESWLALFFALNLLVNTPLGRNVDEVVTDWTVHTWHRIRMRFIAALFRAVMDLFNRILETIERMLYTVDEWLRFRTGESTLTTSGKVVLGLIWMVVNYIIRIFVNLLIEPQINPIKHFPVVTVSHKVLFGFTPALARALAPFLGTATATAIAPTIMLLVPGVFGFLVWELKENWRLYAANRPKNLRPVIVGHHGETIVQFMRPGFRSGTLPKLFAKLRRADRKAYWTGNRKASAKITDGLHRVEEHLRRFVDRELFLILRLSKGWGAAQATTGEIHLATNRILIELYCPELSEDSLWLAFEEQSGWLVATVAHRGWLDRLTDLQRRTLASALAGFFKYAGVDLVREQIEAGWRRHPANEFRRSAEQMPMSPALGIASEGYDIAEGGVVVWRDSTRSSGRLYPVRDSATPDTTDLPEGVHLETDSLERKELIFAAVPISWRQWVLVWEIDQLGGQSRPEILEGFHVLPNGG